MAEHQPIAFHEFDFTLEGARKLDHADPLRSMRQAFHIPQTASGTDTIYLTGNSLGLQPKSTRSAVLEVLDDWEKLGVEAHFNAKNAWMPYHRLLTGQMAEVVGALPEEVVVMNSLSVNLHLLMASFYQPSRERRKILIENHAFPSDRYAVRSQIAWHGFDPENDLIIMGRGENLDITEESDLESVLRESGQEIALVLIGGVNYYTGQLFDLNRIVRAAHEAGAFVGFDLAHAAGNVELKLHDSGADFAAWCSYKYLNAGPGGPSGVFVHQRHGTSLDLPRLSGWWGHDANSRFRMPDSFVPMTGAEGWQLSNPSVLAMSALKASLDVFSSVGMPVLAQKSNLLTTYTLLLLDLECPNSVEVITPRDPARRGAQLSLRVREKAGVWGASRRKVFELLEKAGVICDWREPDVIRLAPVPLYNSFEDVYQFVQELKQAIRSMEEPG